MDLGAAGGKATERLLMECVQMRALVNRNNADFQSSMRDYELGRSMRTRHRHAYLGSAATLSQWPSCAVPHIPAAHAHSSAGGLAASPTECWTTRERTALAPKDSA
jgi:hypothetical protein